MGGVILRTVDPSKREGLAKRFGTTRVELENILFLSPSAIQSELGEITEVEHWQIVLRHYHQPKESYQEVYNEFFAGDEINQELIDFARSLKPKYKVGLLSNAWMNVRENLSAYFDFLNSFDVSIFSAEVGLRKPDERIFNLILDRLDVKPMETVFVDDFSENIKGATALGLKAIHFAGTGQAIADINKLLEN